MWCSCCTPEEQVEWEDHLKYISCNVNRLRKLGKKCIVNKQIGRRNNYLDNDFVECFQKLERSLLGLKKVSVDFLISDSTFQEVKGAHMHNRYLRLQQQLLEIQHQRSTALKLTNTELQAGSSNGQESNYSERPSDLDAPKVQLETNEIAILNEIVDNLRWKLQNSETEVKVLKARIRKLELELQALSSDSLAAEDADEEEAAAQPEVREAYQDTHQENESELSNLLKDVAVTGTETLVRGFMDNFFKDMNEPSNSANMMEMVPLKRNKMKDPLGHGQKKQSKKNLKSRNKPQSNDELAQNADAGGSEVRAPSKFFKKISESKAKVVNKEKSNKSTQSKGRGNKASKSRASGAESEDGEKKKKKE